MDPSGYSILTAEQPRPGGRLVHVREETIRSPAGSAHFFQGRPYPAAEPVGIDAGEVRGLDFVASPFLVPFVSTRLAEVLAAAAAADVQLIDTTDAGFKLLNVLRLIECLSYQRSKFLRYEPTHPNPDLHGKPQVMIDLCVRREAVGGAQVFRVRDWAMPIILGPAVVPGVRALGSRTAGVMPIRAE